MILCSDAVKLYSQVDVTDNHTAGELAQTLLGHGVLIMNASLTCPSNANGIFYTESSNLGLDSGIVLTNGTAATGALTGINGDAMGDASTDNATGGDSDLTQLAGKNTYDACILEFDFRPLGDTISFSYVFGSEEYPTYECSDFNDVFGFLISGPGYPVPQNIALVPGTDIPVCINSVNDSIPHYSPISNCNALGLGSPFTRYYINNSTGTTISYNGFTTLLTARARVTPCDTYHLKMGVADASDHILDSGVFIKAGSIVSNAIAIMPNPVTLCAGDSVQLHATGGLSYVWLPTSGLSCTTCADPVATPVADITYVIAGYHVNGCTDSASVQITVVPRVMTDISPNDTLCAGSSVALSANGGISYLWQPPDGLDDNTIPAPIATPATSTVYTVSITENQCFTDTQQVVVVVNPMVLLTIDSVYSTSTGTSVALMPRISGPATIYNWQPATGLSCANCQSPLASPDATTSYTLTIATDNGCMASAATRVDVSCSEDQLFIPNTFTPNHDGQNDAFYVSGSGVSVLQKFSIYDRWGELLFDAHNVPLNDPAKGWDGTYKGKKLSPDVYIYIIDATCDNGKPLKYKGNVALLR